MGLVVVVGPFLMAGNGANFCITPLIRKPLTGQIAGLIGAYGSVGSVAFMTILLLTNPRTFFLCMAATGLAAVACCFLLRDPVARKSGAHLLRRSDMPQELDAMAAPVVAAGLA